jgi:ribosomal protein S18 acetylase RimI-like enzyme
MPHMEIRAATPADLDSLATIWHDGWHDAHALLLPAALTRLRTRKSFRDRITTALALVRVTGPVGAPIGFHLLRDDELYQLYLSSGARGSGAAAALIADAEARLADGGVETAWLACAIGNERAARFYRKCGWHLAGTMINQVETSAGDFPLEVWRYEKRLAPR